MEVIKNQNKKYPPLCPFHLPAATRFPIKCPFSVDERRKILESSDGCFNCLTLGHRTESYRSTWVQPCRNCGDRHHGVVCKTAPKDTTATPPTPPSEGATGPQVNFYSTAKGPKTILEKGSATVTIEEGPEEEEKDESAPFSFDEPAGMYVYRRLRPGRTQVRSLLDNAAHQSYITQRVANALKMRIIGSRDIGG